MDAQNLIAEIARYAIFEGALPTTRPEDILHLSAKVRSAAAGQGVDAGVEKYLWVHEKEALRLFGPNPAGAATAIRSVIFNYLLPQLGDIPPEALAVELATMEITPETKLEAGRLLKKISKPAKPEKGKPAR